VREYVLVRDPKTYLLIFDNVATATVASPISPNLIEFLPLKNYFGIVTARDPRDLPPRLLSNFTAITLPPFSAATVQSFVTKTADAFLISREFCNCVFALCGAIQRPALAFRLMEIVALVPQCTCRDAKEVEDALRLLLFALRFCLPDVPFDAKFSERFAAMMSYSIAPRSWPTASMVNR
jgi:hypothetical protein